MALSTEELVRLKAEGEEGGTRLSVDAVAAFIAAWPDNVEMAAADCADAIAAKYADGFNFAEDGQSFNRRERFENFSARAQELRRRGGAYVWPF